MAEEVEYGREWNSEYMEDGMDCAHGVRKSESPRERTCLVNNLVRTEIFFGEFLCWAGSMERSVMNL